MCGLLCLYYLVSSVFEAELQDVIPVIHASVAGCRIIGRMCVGELFGLFHYPAS